MKKTVSLILGIVLMFGCVAVNASALANPQYKGDIDMDGGVTSADALTVLKCSVSMEDLTRDQIAVGDMNNDGKITAADALMILKTSVNFIALTAFETDPNYIPTPKDPAILSDIQINQIKEDYLAFYMEKLPLQSTDDMSKYTVDNILIDAYYGTYNGYEIVKIRFGWTGSLSVSHTDIIAGYKLHYRDNHVSYVHVGNTFIKLPEAYNNKILSEQNIHDISCYVNDDF